MATALERYARLEAEGMWFDGQSSRPNPVIVRFGEATLTLSGADDVPRAHWALASLRTLPDQSDAKRLVLVPAPDSDERLVLADAEMIAAIRTVCPDLNRHRAPKGSWRRLIIWGGGAVASVLLIVFVIVPALAERMAVLIPPAQEEALGEQVLAQVSRVFGQFNQVRTCDNPEGLAALDKMSARLAPHYESHVPVKVQILDHPMVNAFAVPGGYVVLMRGLIEGAENPEEVAAVLAHEIGHVIHRDPTRLTLRSAGSAGILSMLIGDVLGGAAIAIMTDAVINASYTRAAEEDADNAAHRIMTGAELPLEPMAGFFERLSDGAPSPSSGVLSHLATHPDLLGRAEAAREADIIGDTRYVPILDAEEWQALRRICRR